MKDSSHAEPTPDLTGREWGDYRVLRQLGSGGMADVYLAEQRSLGRQVALKVLRVELARDASYVQRFSNEARAAASLVHPNIIQIYEVGKEADIHFIAQEYVPGKNLAQLLRRDGAFRPGLVLDILRQVVSALCKAHELRIVHRDLKPENIMLSHSGEVKVADFGLARAMNADVETLTQIGVAMGTPLYMSPEQIEGRPVDARSDIYSLGVTCYHLLSGIPPHTGDTALAIAVQHLNSTPKPLATVRSDVSERLSAVVHWMFAKQPDQRPANPNELLSELRELAAEAARDGWADGPESWSLVERTATQGSSSGVNAQLGSLMKASAQLQVGGWRWGRVLLGVTAALLLGITLGAVSRPQFYLAGPSRVLAVPKRSSAWAQLYHAKLSESEAAWLAVEREFPQASPYLHQLAKQGLVRHYLIAKGEPNKALPVLQELRRLAISEKSRPLEAFVMAGECIANQQLGRVSEAQKAKGQLTADMRDELRSSESQLYDMLQTSLEKLGE